MSVVIIFESGRRVEHRDAAKIRPHGQGIEILAEDGKEIAAYTGPVKSVIVNGKEQPWPPE